MAILAVQVRTFGLQLLSSQSDSRPGQSASVVRWAFPTDKRRDGDDSICCPDLVHQYKAIFAGMPIGRQLHCLFDARA